MLWRCEKLLWRCCGSGRAVEWPKKKILHHGFDFLGPPLVTSLNKVPKKLDVQIILMENHLNVSPRTEWG